MHRLAPTLLAGSWYGPVLAVCSTSLLALCYNTVHNMLIMHLSAVTVTIIGEVKILMLIMCSVMFLGAITCNIMLCSRYLGLACCCWSRHSASQALTECTDIVHHMCWKSQTHMQTRDPHHLPKH